MSPNFTYITPEYKSVIGNFSQDLIYTLIGSTSDFGAWSGATLLSNFNSQWASLQSGGTWSGEDANSNVILTQSNNSGSYSRYISSGVNWPRIFSMSIWSVIPTANAGERSFNIFCCVKDTNNYYRFQIKHDSVNSVSLSSYKKVAGTESALGSKSISVEYDYTASGKYLKWTVDVLPNKIVLSYGPHSLTSTHSSQLSIEDSAITSGSFGLGTNNSNMSFGCPFVYTSPKIIHSQIFKLFPCASGQVQLTSETSNLGSGVNVVSLSPSGAVATWDWYSQSVAQDEEYCGILSSTNEASALIFNTKKLRNYSFLARIRGKGQNKEYGFIIDFRDKLNFVFVSFSGQQTDVVSRQNGVDTILASVLQKSSWDESSFQEWRITVDETKIKIEKNNSLFYDNSPVGFRDSDCQQYGNIGVITSGIGACNIDLFEVYEGGDVLEYEQPFNDSLSESDRIAIFVGNLSSNSSVVIAENASAGVCAKVESTDSLISFVPIVQKNRYFKFAKYKIDIYCSSSGGAIQWGHNEDGCLRVSVSSMTTVKLQYHSFVSGLTFDIFEYTDANENYIDTWLNFCIVQSVDGITVILNGDKIIDVSVSDILLEYPDFDIETTTNGNFSIFVPQTKDTYWKNIIISSLGRNSIGSGAAITDISETMKQSANMIKEFLKTIPLAGSVAGTQKKDLQSEGLIYNYNNQDILVGGSSVLSINKGISSFGSSSLGFEKNIGLSGSLLLVSSLSIFSSGSLIKKFDTSGKDLLSYGASIKELNSSISSYGRSVIQRSSVISLFGSSEKTVNKNIDTRGKAFSFQSYLLTGEYSRDSSTSDNLVSFTLLSSIWEDDGVYLKSWELLFQDEQISSGEFNSATVTVDFSSGDGDYFFVARIYSHDLQLIGEDTYRLTLDTVNPIIQYFYVDNLPYYEKQKITMRTKISGLLLNNVYENIYIVLKNGATTVEDIFVDSYELNSSGILIKTFLYPNFLVGDKINLELTVTDAAGNSASKSIGYDHDGDGQSPAESFVITQRYIYKIAAWHGTYTDEDLQKKYCRNFDYELERGFACPLHEAETMFLPNVRSDCPYCHFPLVSGEFKTNKRLLESNIRQSTPIKSTDEDGLAIIKFGIAKNYFYLPESWNLKIEERSTKYGQDIVNLGQYSLQGESTTRKVHIQIQISRSNAFFQQDLVLVEDTLGDELCFQYQLQDGNWSFISKDGLSLSSASIRYVPSYFINPEVTHFYRWRVIEVDGVIQSQGSWRPQGTGFSALNMTRFVPPTDIWDGSYQEHLLQDNAMFYGMTKKDYLEENQSFFTTGGSIEKAAGSSSYRVLPEGVFYADFSLGRNLASYEELYSIIKVKVRSSGQFLIAPTMRDSSLSRSVITGQDKVVVGNGEWHVLTFDIRDEISGENWDTVGFCATPAQSDSWIEIDYFALLNRNPTRRKYAYLNITSNKMKCVFDEKKTTSNPFNSDGFCLRGHSSNVRFCGIWSDQRSYSVGDVVRNNSYSSFQYHVCVNPTWPGLNATNSYYWQYIGNTFEENSDGLYLGGSVNQNRQTTGHCRNSSCPHFTPEIKIEEKIDFVYDPIAPSITENIFAAEVDAVSGMYFCPNNNSDNQGNPACRNNKMRVAFPPKYKVCSRVEGYIKNADGDLSLRRFSYRCSRFNTNELNESQHDTGGVDATSGLFSTKIPASVVWNNDLQIYIYEQVDPERFRWDYGDNIGACDGTLHDTEEVCGSPLSGIQGIQHCPECGTGLVPYDRANSNISAMKCSNNNKITRIIPNCYLAQSVKPQPSESSVCYECGSPVSVFDARPLIELFSPTRSIQITGENLNLIADGLPKTIAYKGWDSLLSLPYTGPMGGAGATEVEGGWWQGAMAFRKLRASEKEVEIWEQEKEISSNLSSRMTSEISVIQTKKENAYTKQFYNNLENGDIESYVCRPEYVNVPFSLYPLRDCLIENGYLSTDKITMLSYDSSGSRSISMMNSRVMIPKCKSSTAGGYILVSSYLNFKSGSFGSYSNGDILARIVFSKKYTKTARLYISEYGGDEEEKLMGFFFQVRGSSIVIVSAMWDELSNSYREKVLFTENPAILNDKLIQVRFCLYREKCLLEAFVGNIDEDPIYNYWEFVYTENLKFPDEQCSITILAEKPSVSVTSYDVSITGIDPSIHEDFLSLEKFEERNLKLSEPGKSEINEYDQLYFFNKYSAGEIELKSKDEWSETFYLIEIDPRPTFDSRRGLPMRRVWGRGWTCLRKSSGYFDDPSGSFLNEKCHNYKRVWSEEEANALSYICPRCSSGMYMSKIDSSILSLSGHDTNKEKQQLFSPQITHLLLSEELPGLNNSDYMMLDSSPRNGTIDQFDVLQTDSPTMITNPFFSVITDEKLIKNHTPITGWSKTNKSAIVDSRKNQHGGTFGENRDRWFDGFDTESVIDADSTNYVADSLAQNNSTYLPVHEIPKSGRIIEQIVKTGDSFRDNDTSGIYYTSLKQSVDISQDDIQTKRGKLSDIRWSCFIPGSPNIWSALENHFVGDEPYNVTRKISVVEVALYAGLSHAATMKYVISDSLYDYWDTFGFQYTYPDSPWVKFLRSIRTVDKDKWLDFKRNVYDDLASPLQNNLSLSWTDITRIEFRMCTVVVRSQDWHGLPIDYRKLSNVQTVNLCPTVAITIWREFYQGWTTIIPSDSDGKTNKYGPKTWDGIYYYRIVPYSYRINPQWVAFYKNAFLGLGPRISWLHLPLEELSCYYGRDPQKWIYRFQDPLSVSQFKYNYSWHTTYSGIDHVVLPDGMQY